MHAYAEEQFMRSLVRKYGKHLGSTDGGDTWYPSSIHWPENF